MKDIFKKYKKKRQITNVTIIITSLVLALGINFILIDGTNIGQNLKSSVLNSQNQIIKSDLSIEKINNNIYVTANRDMSNVTNISYSISYNPNNIKLNSVNSEIGDILNLSNTPGISSIIISLDKTVNIKKGDKLSKLNISKLNNKTEIINLMNANFKDNNAEQYYLTTSGLVF